MTIITAQVIAFNPLYKLITKSNSAAILLSQLCFWNNVHGGETFWLIDRQTREQTALSRRTIQRAREILVNLGLIKTALRFSKKCKKNVIYYKVNIGRIKELAESYPQRKPKLSTTCANNDVDVRQSGAVDVRQSGRQIDHDQKITKISENFSVNKENKQNNYSNNYNNSYSQGSNVMTNHQAYRENFPSEIKPCAPSLAFEAIAKLRDTMKV